MAGAHAGVIGRAHCSDAHAGTPEGAGGKAVGEGEQKRAGFSPAEARVQPFEGG